VREGDAFFLGPWPLPLACCVGHMAAKVHTHTRSRRAKLREAVLARTSRGPWPAPEYVCCPECAAATCPMFNHATLPAKIPILARAALDAPAGPRQCALSHTLAAESIRAGGAARGRSVSARRNQRGMRQGPQTVAHSEPEPSKRLPHSPF